MINVQKDRHQRISAEDSPWYNFMVATIELDGNKKPHGWHWFWGLYHLHNKISTFPRFNLEMIQNALPEGHPLKEDDSKIVHGYTSKKQQKVLTDLRASLIKINKTNSNRTIEKIEKIDFSRLRFVNEVDFSNLIFPVDTDFRNTKFFLDVRFDDAIFFDTADFKYAEFHERKGAHLRTARFRNTIFKKIADFKSAIFWKYANFKGAVFSGRTTFQLAKFEYNAPRFYDATFNNEITFSGIVPPKFKRALDEEFSKKLNKANNKWADKWTGKWISKWISNPVNKWVGRNVGKNVGKWAGKWAGKCTYKLAGKWFGKWAYKRADRKKKNGKYRDRIQENQNAYETLAYLMDKQKKYHDQHFFFRQEMRCRQKLEHFLIKPFYWLYKWLANYGYGVGHAFIAWLVHIALGVVAIMFFTSYHWGHNLTEFWKILNCATPVSFANANPYAFFSFDGGKLAGCYTKLGYLLPRAFGIIKIIQIVIGVALLFLVLLTLRIRFRLK